jgi:excisionase family DNA binding protein
MVRDCKTGAWGKGATVRFTYDKGADALVVELGGGRTVQTVRLAPGVSANFDREGRLVSVEVLAASASYPRAQLESLTGPMELITTAEAARDTGLHVANIRRQVLAGRIPGARKDGVDWLLPREELWRFLRSSADLKTNRRRDPSSSRGSTSPGKPPTPRPVSRRDAR